MCLHLLQLMRRMMVDQKIKPIIQKRILSGRNIRKNAIFKTADTPIKTDDTRKNIPMTIISGTRKMPNISLHITSDTELIGIPVNQIWIITQVLK
jgi:hypothetical protein